jgi:hypothetical protein
MSIKAIRSAAVPITHTNAKGKTYYLHEGTSKTGNPKYYFSMKSVGPLAEVVPEGFEIYENPNAQVFLRRIPVKMITDAERQLVEDGMRQYAGVRDYKIDVKGNTVLVYTADQSVDEFSHLLKGLQPLIEESVVRELFARSAHYSPTLRFILADERRRLFSVQRYCFLGSIDDWINIGTPGTLTNLVRAYVKHLGKESYFELL